MIGVKAINELLAVDVLLIGRAAIPKVRMPVDDENVFARLRSIHRVLPQTRYVTVLRWRRRASARRQGRPPPAAPLLFLVGSLVLDTVVNFITHTPRTPALPPSCRK